MDLAEARIAAVREAVGSKVDIILENHCSSCKEIFFYASKRDEKIGIATVYRMVSALEEVGVISRKIVYASEQNSGKDEAEKISDKKFQ